ncbi:hypothetical protein V6N12_050452 [Hibiscus sabdariffa]|uniref:Uncharacterized protein n=1 Tax=Hibiscus sabdariffa TaxID=183260 RepID=A0ABR2GCG7_9ROSI
MKKGRPNNSNQKHVKKTMTSCFIIKDVEDQTYLGLASPLGMRKTKPFRSCFFIRDAEDQIVSRSRFIVRDAKDQTSSDLASSSRMQKIKLLQIFLHHQGCGRSNPFRSCFLGLASSSGMRKIKPFKSYFIVRDEKIKHF